MAATGDPRWAELDGLRAVAVLFVLFYHFGAPFGTGGYLGVDLFFVISGCVITSSLRRSLARGGTLPQFFWRRVARLFPNLIAVCLVALAINTWHDRHLLTFHNLALAEQLTQTYDFFLAPDIPTPHLWSLSMEWQFYLLLALVVSVSGRRLSSNAGMVLACTIALGSMAGKWLLPRWFGMNLLHVYFWPFTRLDGFMLGVGIALLAERRRHLRIPAIVPWGALCALLALMFAAPRWWMRPYSSLFGVIPLASVLSAILVGSLTCGPRVRGLRALLAHPVLTYLGERSYSLYLWHYVIGVAIVAALTPPDQAWIGPSGEGWRGTGIFALQMATSMAVAVGAYELIERPARAYLNGVIPWQNRRHDPDSGLSSRASSVLFAHPPRPRHRWGAGP